MSDDMTNAERRVRAGQTFRVVLWLAVLAAVIVFAFVNTDEVNVDWVVKDATAPLWAVIGVSVVAGAIIGFVSRPSRR